MDPDPCLEHQQPWVPGQDRAAPAWTGAQHRHLQPLTLRRCLHILCAHWECPTTAWGVKSLPQTRYSLFNWLRDEYYFSIKLLYLPQTGSQDYSALTMPVISELQSTIITPVPLSSLSLWYFQTNTGDTGKTTSISGNSVHTKAGGVGPKISYHFKPAGTWPASTRERWCKSIAPGGQNVLLQNSESPKFSEAKPTCRHSLQECLWILGINREVSNPLSTAWTTPKGGNSMREHEQLF